MSENVIDPSSARSFLSRRCIAVVGASPDSRKFGNTVYRALRDHGHHVVPVNPTAAEVEGDRCYAAVGHLPADVDAVLVMVPRPAAGDVVRQAAAHGISHVWLFRGLGSDGALSDDALLACQESGMHVVAGACPLMFLEPVRGAHRFHRALRRLNGSLATAS